MLTGLLLVKFIVTAQGADVLWSLETMFGMTQTADAKPAMDLAIGTAKSYFMTNSSVNLSKAAEPQPNRRLPG